MQTSHIRSVTRGALIAALYVVLTYVSSAFGLSSGMVQLRLSEALCVLPAFTKTAVPGLFIGCLLANLLTGCAFWDVVFGSVATLLGAVVAHLIRKNKWLAPLPNIAANTLIIPMVLRRVYGVEQAFPFLMLTVGAGEILSAGVLGSLLTAVLRKRGESLFEDR